MMMQTIYSAYVFHQQDQRAHIYSVCVCVCVCVSVCVSHSEPEMLSPCRCLHKSRFSFEKSFSLPGGQTFVEVFFDLDLFIYRESEPKKTSPVFLDVLSRWSYRNYCCGPQL